MIRDVLSAVGAAYARTVVAVRMVLCLVSVVLLLMSFTCISTSCQGQSDELAVKDVVAQLFKGMELGDSALTHRCFMPEVTMATVKVNKEGQTVLTRETSITGLLKAIGTPRTEKLYEETWNVRATIDGQFAQVWCDYAFYVGNKFSHCGVDAFQLIKDGGTWKIFHLADTRRTTGCDVPHAITKKHAQ